MLLDGDWNGWRLLNQIEQMMQSVGPDMHSRMLRGLINVITLFFHSSLKHCGHGRGFWEAEKGKCHAHLQEGELGRL